MNTAYKLHNYLVEELEIDEHISLSDPDYPVDEEEQWWEDQDKKDWWKQFEKDK